MKVPLSWLKDYVAIDLPARELADHLSFSGSEVAGIETIGSTYDGVVVGEVLDIERHPQSDTLLVCRVNDGSRQLRVVCGAPNVEPGVKAPLARVGAVLADGTKIEAARLRGVLSEGMLCAEDELGLSQDHSGILILADDLAPGTPFVEVAGPPETVLELEITPNRPDCLSIIGIARELAALLGVRLTWPAIDLPEQDPGIERLTRVELEDPAGCPRYTARVLSGVAIGPSPRWMQRRLTLCGMRPINNVVDITNYVMLECGQPLHAFDQTLLAEGRIVVRRARPGETMATLDGVSRAIDPEMLVIADAARPVALAGIMGGAGSEIHDDTKTVLLESAYFEPRQIRRTAKKLALATESSYRFERGIDLGLAEWAGRRAAGLMAAHAGAAVHRGVIDRFPNRPAARVTSCRFARVRALIGMDIPREEITGIFRRLELGVEDETEQGCSVRVPSFRVDIEREADLIEEVARVHGLDKIPVRAPGAQIVPAASDAPVRAMLQCNQALVSLGLAEIMSYSFVPQKLLDLFDPNDAAGRVALPNPVSAEHAILRHSLIPQMVESLGRNRARQAREAALFEMGRVFFKLADGKLGEEDRTAVGLMGPVGRPALEKRQTVRDEDMFGWIRGVLQGLCRALRTGELRLEPAALPGLTPGRAVTVHINGAACGIMGLVAEPVRREWRLLEPVGVLEVRSEALLSRVGHVPHFQPFTAFPAVTRDVAVIVERGVRNEEVQRVIRAEAPPELESIELFDIFAGRGVPAGKKSLAYSCRYRSNDRTLTDDEANRYHESVKTAIRKALGAEIRES